METTAPHKTRWSPLDAVQPDHLPATRPLALRLAKCVLRRLSPHTCWPTQPFPTAHGHPPCRLSTLATHKLTHSRPPSHPNPTTLGTHKFSPPDHLPRTQIQPTRPP